MPSWKKVITSGSSATLYSLLVSNAVTASVFTGSFVGPLQGTSSWANRAVTASYALSSGNTFPYTGSALITGSLGITGSLNVFQSLDTANKLLYDNNGVGTVDWTNLFLSDNATSQSIAWGERALNDLGGVGSVNWSSRWLLDTSGVTSIDWSDTADIFVDKRLNVSQLIIANQGIQVNTGSITVLNGFVSASQGFTGSLFGTASWASRATNATQATSASYADTASFIRTAQTASYVLQAVSSSFASTASYVNRLNQDVVITGSLTVGATTAGASENTLTLGPKGANEGGQLLIQSPTSASFTSASMIDVYADTSTNNQYVRILRGSNAGSDAIISQFNLHTKQVSFPTYTSPTAFTATTLVGLLGFDANGNLLTTTTGSGGGGTPVNITNNTDNYILTATGTANSITGESNLQFNGSTLTVTGNVTATSITSSGAIIAQANNQMYFKGGDDAELWDINVANTVGVYGVQDQGVASIKLGSGGGTISGRSGSIGINITTPNSGALHVSGGVFATSFTGSLQGTSSWASNATTASYILTAQTASFVNTLNQNVLITGSLVVTGSTRGFVVNITPTNQTASLNCALGNMFTLTLSSSVNTILTASNIQPGQAINLRIVQPSPSGSLSYGSQFKFSSGFAYTASATSSVTDIVSFLTFDTSSLFGTSIRNFV